MKEPNAVDAGISAWFVPTGMLAAAVARLRCEPSGSFAYGLPACHKVLFTCRYSDRPNTLQPNMVDDTVHHLVQ